MNPMLANLNDEQMAAVEAVFGCPVLVTAGAGTGKTTVLIGATREVLLNGGIKPWQILVVTFTNKAANEIKKRIEESGHQVSDINWVGTFHSVCLKILRKNAELLGLRKDFLIYGEDDQKSVLKNVMADNGDSTKSLAPYIEKFSRIKDKGSIAF